MMSTILIIGGAGYIGSHTSLYLFQKGYKIIILDNYLHNQEFNPNWAEVIKADYADVQILEKIFTENKIDAVMHFAGFIDVNDSTKNPLKFYVNNVEKTIKLLDVICKYKIKKFIFSSSCSIYGDPEYSPINEQHPKNPINPYGRSKLIIEQILQDLNSPEFSYISLRYFNASGALPEYGLGEQHLTETHLIPLLLRASMLNKPFTVYGGNYDTKDGTCIRDFIHVWDIAQAHWLALQHLEYENPSDFFNLGTGHGFSVKEIINCVKDSLHTNIQTIYAKKREGDAPILVADASKAKLILKWSPKYSDINFIIRSAYAFEHKLQSDQTIAYKRLENC